MSHLFFQIICIKTLLSNWDYKQKTMNSPQWHRTKSMQKLMLKSCSLWFFFIQEVTDVSNTFIRNMSVNIWPTCFHEGYHTIALLSWNKKSCFLWPYSSRRYCWEHVQELALWIQHRCGYVETKESIFIRHLKVWLGVANVQWDGSSDSNYIW